MSDSATGDSDRSERPFANRPLAGRTRRALSRLAGGNRRGTLAMLTGGALFARALRSDGRIRTVLQSLAGLALVGYGIRQRLSGGGSRDGGHGGGGPHDRPDDRTGAIDEKGGPTEAIRHESQTGTNPRDVEQEPDVETETEPDEGSVQFTTDQDDEQGGKPHLDGPETAHDPRREEGDEEVDVDISEAHMADEPAEATGPDPEQAFPSQVEDTEPDLSPEADVSHVEADEPSTDVADEDEEETADAVDSEEDERDEAGTGGESEERGEGEETEDE